MSHWPHFNDAENDTFGAIVPPDDVAHFRRKTVMQVDTTRMTRRALPLLNLPLRSAGAPAKVGAP
jgi:hypothetical protein